MKNITVLWEQNALCTQFSTCITLCLVQTVILPESRSGHRILRLFVVSLSNSTQIQGFSHDRFLPRPFEFIRPVNAIDIYSELLTATLNKAKVNKLLCCNKPVIFFHRYQYSLSSLDLMLLKLMGPNLVTVWPGVYTLSNSANLHLLFYISFGSVYVLS
jgi:hypothetical protein